MKMCHIFIIFGSYNISSDFHTISRPQHHQPVLTDEDALEALHLNLDEWDAEDAHFSFPIEEDLIDEYMIRDNIVDPARGSTGHCIYKQHLAL